MTARTDTAAPAGSAPPRLSPAVLWQRANKSTLLMIGVIVVLFGAFGIASPTFLTFGNLSNLATQIAPAVVVGVAMTFVITSGQIDLSVGSTVAFVAATSAELLAAGLDSALVIPIGIAAGAFWGLVNGWFAAYHRIPPFVVTLATMSVIRGIALLRTEGFSVPIDNRLFLARIGDASFLGFSASAWIALVVAVAGAVLLYTTRFGQYITGIGSQEESVRRAGVNTRRVKMLALVLSGSAAGVAGLLIAARLGSGSANSAQGFELVVIAAVVLGGTDLFGGRGTIVGTLIGAVITGAIANGLTLLGMSPFLTPIVTGCVLILAIWINLRGRDMAELGARLLRRGS
ncbi:monosaccharide ABC transporter membrane protein (CUT2 family) [Murinocardiopsis flavida]|uniref:Monosaccharide ABC transporter membrane protein (CUT2 family) n=1 Tax=Murinocardiopsis flavida TaxID=645275 RepID=A0A2P8DRT8_9ACTN|nr:ABC transporter permease [Murinocardiopsis flavida]PSK99932.1 monosaccharide ABC transporter membrane protein (CUT2 family) [Murinocardiopsis flavida]